MRLPPFSLVAGYLHYWLHAVNEHALHPPFIFDFYTQVIKAATFPPVFTDIEALRHRLQQSDQVIDTEDMGAGSLKSSSRQRKIGTIARHSLTSPKYAHLLFRMVQHQPSHHILELGTSLGINTLYLSAAAPRGEVYTIEGCRATAATAQTHFDNWPVKNIHMITGNIDHTLPSLLQRLPALDFLYMDANHRYSPTLHYYEQCKAKAHDRSIFVIDDIYWSAEMKKAWQEIIRDQEARLTLDLFKMGIVFFKKLRNKQHYTLMF